MKALTKKQRLEAYRWALEDQSELFKYWQSSIGLCIVLRRWLRYNEVPSNDIFYTRVAEWFEEFNLFRPKRLTELGYWFENAEERLSCLAFCIAICQDSKN